LEKNYTFADESTLTIEQMLEGTTPIDTPKHGFKNFDEARQWAKKNIIGTYKNDNTGENLRVSNKIIGKYLSEKAVKKSVSIDAHLSALMQLPSLVKTSILKESSPDSENSRNIKEVQRFYGAINYEGKTYLVKLTVKVLVDKINNVYTYEVIDIENPNGQKSRSDKSMAGTSESATPDNAGLVSSLLPLSPDKGSKNNSNNQIFNEKNND
jgi:hypothetical protein